MLKVSQSVIPNSMTQKPFVWNFYRRTPSTVYPVMLYRTRRGAIIAKTLTTCCTTNFNSNSTPGGIKLDEYNRYRHARIHLQRNSFRENLRSSFAESANHPRRIDKVPLMQQFKFSARQKKRSFQNKVLN